MKKKGFTLIELLAVIVILAIIALIATPIVMNVIESSRKGAAERSYENYVRAVETAIAEERINGPIEDGTYEVMSDGNLCKGTISGTNCEGTKLSVEVSGTKPATGSTVKVENGLITKGNDTTLSIGDYTVKYNPTTNKVEATKEQEGSTVAKICTYDESSTVAAGQIGAKYNCTVAEGVTKQFYLLEIGGEFTKTPADTVYSDEEEHTSFRTSEAGEVSLLMSENIDNDYFDWGNPDAEQVTVLSKLQEKTTGWTVEVYLPLPVQLMSEEDFFNEKLDDPILGEDSGLPYGFWTSLYSVSEGSGICYGKAHNTITPSCVRIGIRPVITIPAAELEE